MPNNDFWGGLTVSLLGCGWLGTALAEDILSLGSIVKGSTTHASKSSQLTSIGINSHVIHCSDILEGENLETFFDSDVLIVTLPFKRSFEDPLYYVSQLRAIAAQIPNSRIKTLIFTSSTGIYDGCSGDVTEESHVCLDKPRVSALQQAESLILALPTVSSCVLRLGGLYGGSRQLGSFLSKKSRLRSGNAPVNLIHQQDCVGIIKSCIEHPYEGILNAVSDEHPTREKVYTSASLRLGISPPHFEASRHDIFKRKVNNARLKTILDYTFIHPNPAL